MRLFLALPVFAGMAAEVKLPDSPADLARGEKLYRGSCGYCHGPQGDGGKGANLARQKLERAATDEKLVNIIQNGITGTEMPGAWHMTEREVTQVAAFVRTFSKVESKPVPGDPVNGKALYSKHGCRNCHTVGREGGLMGPDLSEIGSRRSPSHLRESLLDPSASVPGGFLYTKIVTKAGKTIEGQRLWEDTFAIAVRDFAGNNHAFPKTDLQDVSKDFNKSPMPSFKGKLSDSGLDDLIAYLASLKEVK
jgi:putative heme-binding domain-containing protein